MSDIIPNEYTLPLRITAESGDAQGRLRLSAILRRQQEAGDAHLTAGGLTWEALYRRGLVFVAYRWRAAVTRMPRVGECVTLTTWHRERKGPRFSRCYEWRDEDGAPLVCGVMQFALVSAAEHRLLRGTEFDVFGLPEHPDRTVPCGDPAAVRFPADAAPAGAYTVVPADIDQNGHMNNARYADVIAAHLPAGAAVREINLHFAGECRLGDVIALRTARRDGAVLLQGAVGDRPAFTAAVTLAEVCHDI